ncbi:heavy metal translocating P-type ATPase [Salinisphaera sp. USBA-960]|nr:heavy metal translocating P-type ATPase [Salifodinibacter halophilus]NNC27210.1 heavy metal translocating P-type ATPase [Salifodinibacter halophilus]
MNSDSGLQRVDFGVDGMTCGSCSARVEKVLGRVDGVERASVNLTTQRADVELDPRQTGVSDVFSAVEKAGYTPVAERIEFGIEGMSCGGCAARAEKNLNALTGVVSASVNIATERARVDYLAGTIARDALFSAVEKAGFSPIEPDTDNTQTSAESPSDAAIYKQSLLFAVVFTVPLFVVAMASMVPGVGTAMHDVLPERGWQLIELLLVLPVQFWAGRNFYRFGWRECRHLAPGMNSLVMIGSSAAFLYSLAALAIPGVFPAETAQTYFDAAGMIITLILLGRYLEALAKGRTSEAVHQLMALHAPTARVARDGQWQTIDADEVVVGDVVQVRPGERIPVDGAVTAGNSYVDESMISGEPVPVEKSADAETIGGTVNQNGQLEVRVMRTGNDTVLAKIVRMVESAQSEKPAIQAIADRIAGVFVPVILVVAAVTFAAWMAFGASPALPTAFVTAVAVLLIACPCAMGLATPAAIMVATGRGARMGVLFRRGTAVEQLASVATVVFDKTGTLTEGTPRLTELETTGGFDRRAVLRLVASVEAKSEHPLGAALVAAARDDALEIAGAHAFTTYPGQGVEAVVDDRRVQVGSSAYLASLGIETGAFAARAEELAHQARTPLFVAVDGQLAALVAVSDPIRDDARRTIEALHAAGLEIAMLTGDNRATAEAVAAEIGIDRVMADVMPDAKADQIKRLQDSANAVAFVGDGVNDAPALTRADVGIAVGSGTDIAIEAGDVVLMRADLTGVVGALQLARRAMRVIRQNFGWAYGYNVLLIPVAAGVLYPATGWLLSPVLAAGAMGASDVMVLANSLRLRRGGGVGAEMAARDDGRANGPTDRDRPHESGQGTSKTA